jgi:chorismate synthase
MAANSFGTIFKITTWGESHGKGIGVVIDGCPAGIEIDESHINLALCKRAPGKTPFTSPRKEKDEAEIWSGVYKGKTTGAPISIIIANKDVDSSKYESIKDIYRPGHANYTFLQKYGIFDERGGGRASARETAARVAAGTVASQLLKHYEIETLAFLSKVGPLELVSESSFDDLKTNRDKSVIFCPDLDLSKKIEEYLFSIMQQGDSIGGAVQFTTKSLPVSLGDPVYEKLQAKLASGFFSIPGCKAFEMGKGVACSDMRGFNHNDRFECQKGRVQLSTNNSGGVLGGISNGMPLRGQVHFKPASSIKIDQPSVTIDNKPAIFSLPQGSRHDPCVAIRAVFVVEAMLNLVLADLILFNRSSKI